MKRRLILIRHAKSGWDNIYADDHARTLTERGIVAAEAIGLWLAENEYTPDLILTSDAIRALQTTTHIQRGMSAQIQTKEMGMLYHAAPETIQDIAGREVTGTVALVGHNPGIGMAARRFVTFGPDHRRFDDYPTCATTVIAFENEDWLKPGRGKVVDFTVPRDL